MTQLIFVNQARGGAGKSTFTFLAAEKFQDAIVLDCDDATRASLKQLAYRNPIKVSFLDPITQRIDRSAFDTLFESVASSNKKLFIADAGASISEQFPKYLQINTAKSISEMLAASGIELQIVCVIGGANNFRSTMDYLVELVESVEGHFGIIAAHNRHFPFSDNQESIFQDFVKDNNLKSISFDLVNDKGELALRTAENILQSGKGLSGLSPFKAVYFKNAIDGINF